MSESKKPDPELGNARASGEGEASGPELHTICQEACGGDRWLVACSCGWIRAGELPGLAAFRAHHAHKMEAERRRRCTDWRHCIDKDPAHKGDHWNDSGSKLPAGTESVHHASDCPGKVTTSAGSSSAPTPAMTPLERDLLEALRDLAQAAFATDALSASHPAYAKARAAIAKATGGES